MERMQLEAIWNDSSSQWHFEFEHREEIKNQVGVFFNYINVLKLVLF
jgi:hypothetical protein